MILPFFAILIILYLVSLPKFKIFQNLIFIFIFILFISNIINIQLFSQYIINSNNDNKQLMAEKANEELENINLELLHKQYSNHFSLLHDTKNDLIRIIDLAQNKQIALVIDFAYDLYTNFTTKLSYTLSQSEVFNLAYDEVFKELIDNSIHCKVQLQETTFSCLTINNQLQLFRLLFSTSISNAISCKYGDRIIIFKSTKYNNQILISTDFSLESNQYILPERLEILVTKNNGYITYLVKKVANIMVCSIEIIFY